MRRPRITIRNMMRAVAVAALAFAVLPMSSQGRRGVYDCAKIDLDDTCVQVGLDRNWERDPREKDTLTNASLDQVRSWCVVRRVGQPRIALVVLSHLMRGRGRRVRALTIGVAGILIGLMANVLTANAELTLLAEPVGARIRPMVQTAAPFAGGGARSMRGRRGTGGSPGGGNTMVGGRRIDLRAVTVPLGLDPLSVCGPASALGPPPVRQ